MYTQKRRADHLTSSDETLEAKLPCSESVLFVHLHSHITLVYQGGDVVGHLQPLEGPGVAPSCHVPEQH